jgi:hypothetical protein
MQRHCLHCHNSPGILLCSLEMFLDLSQNAHIPIRTLFFHHVCRQAQLLMGILKLLFSPAVLSKLATPGVRETIE